MPQLTIDVYSTLLSEKELAKEIVDKLSKRELECFLLLAKGLSNKSVAIELGLAYRTVNSNHHRIRNKLNLASSAHTAILGWRVLNHIKELQKQN